MLPTTWEDVCKGPSFLLWMERHAFRKRLTEPCLFEAGFQQLRCVSAWDGFLDPAATDAKLAELGIQMCPHHGPGHKGCTLSHILLWKRIVEEELPFATIFEDDVLPHRDINHGIGHQWWEQTPKDAEIVYLGNMLQPPVEDTPVIKVGTHCTHAYVISLEGAKKCLALIEECVQRFGFINMIDTFLYQMATVGVLNTVCWNGTMLQKSYPTYDPGLPWQFFDYVIVPIKDTGLFYQNYRCGTGISNAELSMEVPNYFS